MKGYKMVKPDGTSYYDGKTMYEVGRDVIVDGPKDGAPCGVGLHISEKPYGPLNYNARYPWKLLEVEYDEADVLGRDNDKVRVRKLTVIRELRPFRDLGLPNSDRLEATIERCLKIRLKPQNDKSKKAIRGMVRKYMTALNAIDPERPVRIKTVRFYTLSLWASIRASISDSIRASISDSIRASISDSIRASISDSIGASIWASIWASIGEKYTTILDTELRILEAGVVLAGITDDGIAHVVMAEKGELVR